MVNIPYMDKIFMTLLGISALIFVILILKDVFTSLEWFDILHKKYGYEVDETRLARNYNRSKSEQLTTQIDDKYLSENSAPIIKTEKGDIK